MGMLIINLWNKRRCFKSFVMFKTSTVARGIISVHLRHRRIFVFVVAYRVALFQYKDWKSVISFIALLNHQSSLTGHWNIVRVLWPMTSRSPDQWLLVIFLPGGACPMWISEPLKFLQFSMSQSKMSHFCSLFCAWELWLWVQSYVRIQWIQIFFVWFSQT